MAEQVKNDLFEQSAPEMGKTESFTNRLRRWKDAVLLHFHVMSLFFAAAGFLLGGASVAEQLSPFGIAWYGALGAVDRRNLLFQWAPVMAGYLIWAPHPLVYGAILLLLFVFLGLYTPAGKKPRLLLPLTVFSAVIAVRGIFLVFSGISDLLLVIIFVESILAAGLSFVLYMAAETFHRLAYVDKLGREELLCTFVFVVSVLLGMERVAFGTVALSDVAMGLVILIGALLAGAGGGAAMGALMGIVPGLAGLTAPEALGVFAFSGLLAGVFQRFGRLGVIVGYVAGNLLLTFYLLSTSHILSSIVVALVSSLLFLLIPQGMMFRCKELFHPGTAIPRGPKQKFYHDYARSRLGEISQGFSELEVAVEQCQQNVTPLEEKNIKSILAHISRKVCRECSLKEMCWKDDFYNSYRDVMTMFAAAEARGVVTSKDVPTALKRRCSHEKEMVATVNCLYEMYRQGEYWQGQVAAGRRLTIDQLKNTSELLEKIGREMRTFQDLRNVLAGKLPGALRAEGFSVDYLTVAEANDKVIDLRLRTRRCRGGGVCGETVADAIYDLTGKNFFAASCQCSKERNELCRCTLLKEGALNLDIGSLQIPKNGSGISGDFAADFLLPDAAYGLMICDGMGSGEEARDSAKRTAELVQNMLQCGFQKDFAAEMVNYLTIMDRKNEVFATMDLCVIDRHKKEACFVKMGAATSYIYSSRHGREGVRRISGNSLPLGGIHDQTAEIFREPVAPGDMILMISDGILDTGVNRDEMEYWLTRTFAESAGEEARIVAERLLNGALAFSKGSARDDMTVTAVVIKE